jgi:magnesium chelatase family protein
MPRSRAQELAAGPAEASAAVRSRVETARARPLKEWDDEANALIDQAVDRMPLSGRGRARARRVAQTIAALAGEGRVGTVHVSEALSYRAPRELETA